ncbi:T9SS type A sorting domain-containing protein, partial [Flavobacterium rhizosphaerae]
QDFCTGATAEELEATASEGATLVWYDSDNVVIEGTDELTAGTYYVSQAANGCESVQTEVTVVINPTPDAPAAAATQDFCTGATAEELEATASEGATLVWYYSDNVVIEGTEELAAGTYYVSQVTGDCESVQTEVTVVVNATPDAPVAEATQDFCTGATADELEATASEGATLVWYDSDNVEIEGTEELAAGTYYVSQVTGDCESVMVEVTVTVNAIPDAPTGEATQSFDAGDTVGDLEVTYAEGTTANWYMLNLAGELVAVSAEDALVDGGVYYVSQTANGCDSDYLIITVDQTTATDKFDTKALMVYPNPAQELLTVTYRDAITKVVITNVLGQTVLEQTANTTTVQVNVASLPGGNYLVQVQTASGAANVKIVKQ